MIPDMIDHMYRTHVLGVKPEALEKSYIPDEAESISNTEEIYEVENLNYYRSKSMI